jgi:NADH-quinone oxidoreductase subunit J
MNASAIFFYCISAFILGMGLLAVTTRKIFRAAIWLLFSLVGIAALYFWLQVEFVAAVQIVVYVGGIVVLIIFSVFLTQQSGKEMPKPPVQRVMAALLAAIFGLAFIGRIIQLQQFNDTERGSLQVSAADIGMQMLSTTEHGYILPFEVVSILLLAAMIGCIVIALRSKEETKSSSKTA